ncbi:MAG: AMP-binding protein [Verrucomicrobiota bacterium]
MPYLRWLETSRRFAARPAIFDGDGIVTFEDLADAVKRTSRVTSPVIARTGSITFFVEILRAWRDGQPVIPVEREAPEPVLHCPPPPETCLVKYTPGASGIPRGIFLNAAQVAADGDRIVSAMGLTAATPNLAVISLAHSYGFSNVVLPLILHGVPVHLAPVPFPRAIDEIFKQHPSLVVPAVPSMWRAWHRAGILKDAPISLAISAGAPLALALEADVLAASGLKIRNFYGASECGGISFDTSATLREFADDVGTPLPGVDVSITGEGRIMVHSSSVATCYDAPRPDDVLGNDGYLTRDLGNIDSSGKIHLTGTLGGAINVAGRKVSPAKVEAAITATDLVRRIHVRGIPSNDPERFEEIAAEVELLDGVALDAVKSAASEKLQSWELPRHWKVFRM